MKRKQSHVCVYRNLSDTVHKDSARSVKEHPTPGNASGSSPSTSSDSSDSQDVIRYNRTWHAPQPARVPLFTPTTDPELDSLCFFFNNYVNIPRETHSNIIVEHILPLWRQAPEDSPIKTATAAIAANISELWRLKGPDSEMGRSNYSKTLISLRHALQDPESFNSDEILGTMFMLDFYESLCRRYQQAKEADVHQKAAMAIVKSRSRSSMKSETSRRLFTALRARYILFKLQAHERVELDEELLQDDPEMDLPGAKLDLILADLANVMYDGSHLLELRQVHVGTTSTPAPEPWHFPDGSPMDAKMQFDDFLSYLLEINLRLNGWRNNLPPSWESYRIPDAESSLHHSIRAVGIYNGLCDVYASTATAHTLNGWRSTKVLVLRLIKHCLRHLDPESPSNYVMPGDEIDCQIQKLVDDICATVPFHLGSRTTLALPHQHHYYPPVPPFIRATANYVDSSGRSVQMTDNDHIRSAAAVGGWFVLTPLTAIMRYAQPLPSEQNAPLRLEPLNMRPGQLEWVQGQVKRIHKIYVLPMPSFGNTPVGNRVAPIVNIGEPIETGETGFMVGHGNNTWTPPASS